MPDPRPHPDPDLPDTAPHPSAGEGPVFREGNTVHGYRLLHRLGEGGMGVVFAARDERLGRTVALKVMHPEAAAGRVNRERFVREARATAALEHDHVVRLYHVGEADGQPFLVMELLAGESLRSRLARAGRVPLAEAVAIARDVARGLAAAHDRGLVHRDVTPNNVWLEPSGRAKLLDFGLAHAPDAPGDRLTRSGAVMGTPGFMSPEQAAGEPTDARSDLFSLGCVLYLLATGAKPFPGTGKTPGSEIAAVLTRDPAPPRELNPDIPEPLDRLIRDLLAKAPADRPTSAAEVADRLSAILQELPAADTARATASTAGDRTRTWRPDQKPAPDRPRLAVSVKAGCVTLTAVVGCVLAAVIALPAFLGRNADRTFTQVGTAIKPGAAPEPKPPPPPPTPPVIALGGGEKRKEGGVRFPPLDPVWARAFAALPAEKQAGELTAEFRRRNPDFRGAVELERDEEGAVYLTVTGGDPVADVTPARAVRKLLGFSCPGSAPRAGRLEDLSPLADLPLVTLYVENTRVRDLAVVRTFATSAGVYVLDVAGTAVADLGPLRGVNVQQLDLRHTPVKDLSPLADVPLKIIDFDWPNGPDPAPLRKIAGLREINGEPAAKFWAKVK